MLRKAMEKAQKEKQKLDMRKQTVHENKNEFLNQVKQRFELAQTVTINDGDFEDHHEIDENPQFTAV